MKYNEKNKKELKKIVRCMCKDLFYILDRSDKKTIEHVFEYDKNVTGVDYSSRFFNSDKWGLCVTKNHIMFYYAPTEYIYLDNEDCEKNDEDFTEKELSDMSLVLTKAYYYDNVKQSITFRLEEEQRDSNSVDEILASYSDREKQLLGDLVVVDISNSTNQPRIEITNQNGCKIGTLDFGDKTINFVTSGNIVITNKDKSSSEEINKGK